MSRERWRSERDVGEPAPYPFIQARHAPRRRLGVALYVATVVVVLAAVTFGAPWIAAAL